MNGDGLALAEFDAMAVFHQELGPALADSTHLANRVLEEVAFVASVAAVGGWEDEGGHWATVRFRIHVQATKKDAQCGHAEDSATVS